MGTATMTRNKKGLIAGSALLLFAVANISLVEYLKSMSTDYINGTLFGASLMMGLLALASRRIREIP